MLQYIAASAHNLYSKYAHIYLQIKQKLENKTRKNDYEQYIQLYERLQQGYYVIRLNGVKGFGEDLLHI